MIEAVSAVQSASGLQIREDPAYIAAVRQFAVQSDERADNIAEVLKLAGIIVKHDVLNVQKDRVERAAVAWGNVDKLNRIIAELSELSACMKEAAVRIERGEVA